MNVAAARLRQVADFLEQHGLDDEHLLGVNADDRRGVVVHLRWPAFDRLVPLDKRVHDAPEPYLVTGARWRHVRATVDGLTLLGLEDVPWPSGFTQRPSVGDLRRHHREGTEVDLDLVVRHVDGDRVHFGESPSSNEYGGWASWTDGQWITPCVRVSK